LKDYYDGEEFTLVKSYMNEGLTDFEKGLKYEQFKEKGINISII